jgi:lipid-binding SYLF domain-containing protein
MKYLINSIVLVTLLVTLQCCAAPGNNPAEQRISIDKMAKEVLQELYKIKPDVRSQINSSAGYAVFSNANVNIIFFSASGGYGVVRDNGTKKRTYMKMAEAGVGLGLGVKDFRAVFVFHNAKTLNRFIEEGWQFGGHADAAAKAGDKGASMEGEMVVDNISIYQITESGLALQLTVKGTKYWKDKGLN